MTEKEFIDSALRTISIESKAVNDLADKVGESFAKACELILACHGRVIVTGIGKSGHIARKISATLSSTGTPAFFMHPGEAGHGDLGMVTRSDLVIAISSSGKSAEIIPLIPLIKRMGCPLICMTGDLSSPLAQAADTHIDISVETEACPLQLAPTSSTTATLVMGDALAMALLEARGFSEEDFAHSHPGGQLGRRLLWHVRELMHTESELPASSSGSTISEALQEMSRKSLGITCILEKNQLLGIFTDGDLRRCINNSIDLTQVKIDDVMTKKPRTVGPNTLAVEALNLMESHKITALAVIDDKNNLVGILHLHDLLRAGII